MLPDYWIRRPPLELDGTARVAADRLLREIGSGECDVVRRDALPVPPWKFLCYAGDHGVALHGTGAPQIEVFEPRQPEDLTEFGNQKAVYAAGDGLWAMFFAIVDRTNFSMSLANACVRVPDGSGGTVPYYVFSVSWDARRHEPWRTGYVYLLPGSPFRIQPAMVLDGVEFMVPQLASSEAVRPLAKVEVHPDDFPLLDDIRGHDGHRLEVYARAMERLEPWPVEA